MRSKNVLNSELSVEAERTYLMMLESARSVDTVKLDENNIDHLRRTLPEYRYYIPKLWDILKDLQSRGVQLTGLDVGCGMGVAAESIRKHYGIDMSGLDLVDYPDISNRPHLPKDKIIISDLASARFPKESFDLIIALGSLTVSKTLEVDGPRVLELVKPGGYVIVAPVVPFDPMSIEPMVRLAKELNFSVWTDNNVEGKPCYVFKRDGKQGSVG